MNTTELKSLDAWLAYLYQINPEEIVLGLDRVKAVLEKMGFQKPSCPLMIVGGTNGKGSCVATLEKIYSAAGYRVGVFTSPYLIRHTELLRFQEQELSEAVFCEAYAFIEKVRGTILLTPFEYTTLAAIFIFSRLPCDLWIFEVGLGGRLDAVNVLDADLCLLSSIGLDHMDRLGSTREAIGFEKAGIFRKGRPVVCGDFDPPETVVRQALSLEAPFYVQGRDFSYVLKEQAWDFHSLRQDYVDLPFSKLALQNSASALMALELLQMILPVSEEALHQGLSSVYLPGRIEIKAERPWELRDVAHNPAAVAFLREGLKRVPIQGRIKAVFSMLADKDLAGSLRELKERVDEWYVAPLKGKRATCLERLKAVFEAEGIERVLFYESIEEAYRVGKASLEEEDCLLVFGSFYTVAACGG